MCIWIYKKRATKFSGKGLDAKVSEVIEGYKDWMWMQELRNFIKIEINNSKGYAWKAIVQKELEGGQRLEIIKGEKLELLI